MSGKKAIAYGGRFTIALLPTKKRSHFQFPLSDRSPVLLCDCTKAITKKYERTQSPIINALAYSGRFTIAHLFTQKRSPLCNHTIYIEPTFRTSYSCWLLFSLFRCLRPHDITTLSFGLGESPQCSSPFASLFSTSYYLISQFIITGLSFVEYLLHIIAYCLLYRVVSDNIIFCYQVFVV